MRAGRARRARRARGRRRALVHRRGAHRRRAALARRDGRDRVGGPADAARARAGRHPPARRCRQRLARYGLALENMGDVDAQSIAGATATGTHGTGVELRNLSAAIEAVQLVAGDGTVHEIDGGDELLAARVSVGALGVDHRDDAALLARVRAAGASTRPRRSTTSSTASTSSPTDTRHFEFYSFPHSETVLTRTNEIVSAPAAAAGPRAALGRGRPAQQPRAPPRVRAGEGAPAVDPGDQPHDHEHAERPRADRPLGPDLRQPRATSASPRWSRRSRARPRATRSRAILEEVRRHPVIFPIELRFVAGDEALLSPAGGRETVYIAVHNYVGMPWEPYFRAVARDRRRARRAPALGQAPLPHGGDARAALPGVGALPGRPRAARPGGPVHERVRGAGARGAGGAFRRSASLNAFDRASSSAFSSAAPVERGGELVDHALAAARARRARRGACRRRASASRRATAPPRPGARSTARMTNQATRASVAMRGMVNFAQVRGASCAGKHNRPPNATPLRGRQPPHRGTSGRLRRRDRPGPGAARSKRSHSSPAFACRRKTTSPTAGGRPPRRAAASGPRPRPPADRARSPAGRWGSGSLSGPAAPLATYPPPSAVATPGPGRRTTGSANSAAGRGVKLVYAEKSDGA